MILRSLPARLKEEFPAILLHGDGEMGSGSNVWNWRALGVSTNLWNLVMGSLRAGLRKEVILGLLWAVQHGVPDFSGDAGAQQQPQSSSQAVPQTSAQAEQEQSPDHKMIEDEDEDDTRNQERNTKENEPSQTLSSTVRIYNCRES